jgi:acetyltransferase-like isoleucine patch superfamily enzyme
MKNVFKKLNKISIIKSFLVSQFHIQNESINSKYTSCFIYRKTICDLHKSSRIQVKGGCVSFNVPYGNKNPFDGLLILRESSKIIVNGKFEIQQGFRISVNENATLELNSGYINANANISCFKSIRIGEKTIISENVTIRDSDNHKIIGNQNSVTQGISIGKHVWIGINSTILKGVTIGDGSIIAANSLVNKDIPKNCLAGGNPAIIIKENVSWE